jgi:hypothetical protein
MEFDPTRDAIFSVYCSDGSELLGPYCTRFPGWYFPMAESPMADADIKSKFSCYSGARSHLDFMRFEDLRFVPYNTNVIQPSKVL